MSSQPQWRVLFQEGDLARTAFLTKGGKVTLSGAHLPDIEVQCEEFLLGVVELFLSDGGVPPRRLCTVSVSADAQVSEVNFEKVISLAGDYEYGISTNRFLALLLERTNDLLRTMFRSMPQQWRSYQELAMLYYDVVNRWEGLASRSGVTEYLGLVNESKQVELYSVGTRFQQERAVSCIAFGSGWLTSAQRFSKEQAICRAGDVADCMYILLEGCVHVAKPNQIFATISQPGECFGELAFFLKGKRTADLIATAGTALLRLDTSSLKEFHATHPDMFVQIAGTLAKRIQANLITLERHYATKPEQAASEAAALNASARKTIDGFLEKMRRFLRIASNFEISELVSCAQEELSKID
jgi:CRP-like cAMP-binding protein